MANEMGYSDVVVLDYVLLVSRQEVLLSVPYVAFTLNSVMRNSLVKGSRVINRFEIFYRIIFY